MWIRPPKVRAIIHNYDVEGSEDSPNFDIRVDEHGDKYEYLEFYHE